MYWSVGHERVMLPKVVKESTDLLFVTFYPFAARLFLLYHPRSKDEWKV